MKYLGYGVILAAFIAGFLTIHPAIIVIAALISTFIYAAARRKALKQQPQAPDQNMLFDGAYLFAGQLLIMFTAFILGWFLANLGTPSGMLGRTMMAFVIIGIAGISIGLLGRKLGKNE